MNTTPVTRRTEVFPLLMNFTHATPVEEWNGNEKVLYDEINEIVYDTRTIGTKCLKSKCTKLSPGRSTTDKFNAIDDSKNVK